MAYAWEKGCNTFYADVRVAINIVLQHTVNNRVLA